MPDDVSHLEAGRQLDEPGRRRDHLVDVANTRIGDRGVFSGFGDTAVTRSGGAWTYAGDGGEVKRQIGPSMSVTVIQTCAPA